ncbi:MAG: fumarylacetoacetate hydrolase family protein, partial [Vitreoscilla sp.]|nr:fumarylacetoacetate hydrolase family protein [Vitreoscilla sp.]
MQLAIEAPPLHTLAIAGRVERFPVNRVFCVGRNYAAHAREMGKDPDREPPFFFMKPANAVVDAASPTSVPYPPKTKNYHHEIELVVAIGRGGRDIPIAQALEHVYGYAIGLDMTRRDLQLEARDKGR